VPGQRRQGIMAGVADPSTPGRTGTPENQPRLLVVSGLSGAGRSAVADTLEDLGWYVVDNLPPELLPHLYEQVTGAGMNRLAAVLDVRSGSFFDALPTMFEDLRRRGIAPEIVFVEADDEVIVRRQESVRRPLPLQGDGRLLDGIQAERHQLAALRGAADLVIDTSELNVHQLSSRVRLAFGGDTVESLRLTVLSFGFKNGIPVDADVVMDVRFLPNPHWEPELRSRTGLEALVRDFVLSQPGAREFIGQLTELVSGMAAGYLREGKRFATVAIGCTGGKHRSTAIAEEFAERMRAGGMHATALHRDLGLE